MNLLYIGAGFVGTCSAAVSADSGHQTLVYDIDHTKIQMLGSGERDQIESCLYEKGLSDLLIRNKERVRFTTEYTEVMACVDTVDAIFLCLPTPEIGETGASDLSYYTSAMEALAPVLAARNGGNQDQYVVLVNKSTVPINTIELTEHILDSHGVLNVGVVSNPEFLVEGKAIEGSLKPDRIVIGAWHERDFAVMRRVYQRFYQTSSTLEYIEVNPKEAAAGKLLANFYLFNKLQVCFDVMGRTAEAFDDISFEHVRNIIASDKRIGTWGFYNSLYAGGSCFIKDARSLAHQLETAGKETSVVKETYLANTRQLETFFARAEKEAGFDWHGKHVALLGTAFKRDTNDIRNSPSIELVRYMKEQHVGLIRVYDPSAVPMFQSIYPECDTIQYVDHEFEAMKHADVIIIATDWPQFRGLADVIIKELTKKPLIMDGRRMLHHRYADLAAAGCDILAVGSPFIPKQH